MKNICIFIGGMLAGVASVFAAATAAVALEERQKKTDVILDGNDKVKVTEDKSEGEVEPEAETT